MLVECIPNISEGRRPEIVSACVEAVRGAGATILDVTSDVDHNRSVLTFVGAPDMMEGAVEALFAAALPRIDLRMHRGVHPRIGAVDVVPFVPLHGATMEVCVDLARRIGARVGRLFHVPVFMYEEAARRPERRALERIRRGQFEGLGPKLQDPEWAPDFGPAVPHPSAGATVIGARRPLVAFNVNLATDQIEVAQAIAGAVRASSGGLPAVKALGVSLAARGIVQVTMNLTDLDETSIDRAFDAVSAEAERLGVAILESELVGLVPCAAIAAAGARYLRLPRFRPDQVLEERIQSVTRD
jgi:glutamate formiminotransferase